jgi:hypothetical protein
MLGWQRSERRRLATGDIWLACSVSAAISGSCGLPAQGHAACVGSFAHFQLEYKSACTVPLDASASGKLNKP